MIIAAVESWAPNQHMSTKRLSAWLLVLGIVTGVFGFLSLAGWVIPFGSDTPKLASAFLRVVKSYS
jgi:hypothetical protein